MGARTLDIYRVKMTSDISLQRLRMLLVPPMRVESGSVFHATLQVRFF